MNNELILEKDILDILFEQRNKEYGAYILRKYYSNRLIKSLGWMLVIATILSGLTFIRGKDVITVKDLVIMDPSIIKIDQIKEKPKASEAKASVVKDRSQRGSLLTIVKEQDSVSRFSDISDSTATGKFPVAGALGGFGLAGPDSTQIKAPSKTFPPFVEIPGPINNPDVEPAYPGGINALRKFLEKNLINPRSMEEGETVSVVVKFVVGYDGKLQGFEILRDGGNEFNNEVIRVLKKMPEWIPGKSKGQNVSVYYAIPVKFITTD